MKRALAVTFLALLFSVLTVTTLVNSAKANFYSPSIPTTVTVTITSPKNNEVYLSSNIPLAFTIDLTYDKRNQVFQNIVSYTYSLNGKQTDFVPSQTQSGDSIYCTTTLKEIPEGTNNLKIIVQTGFFHTCWEISSTVSGFSEPTSFTVKGTPPSITIMSTQDKSYDTRVVALNFTISEPVSWIGYSLDEKTNVSITESSQATYLYGRYNYNMVLNGLAEGTHTLTLYASDIAGNTGKSEPLYFTVTQGSQDQNLEPPPTTFAGFVIIASIAIVSFGLAAYFLRRNRRRSK